MNEDILEILCPLILFLIIYGIAKWSNKGGE